METGDTGPSGRLLGSPVGSLEQQAAPELLQADIEVFGLALASLESARCPRTMDRPLTVQTRVTAAPVVKVVRRTSGDARTEFDPETAGPTSSDYNLRDGDLLRHYRVEHEDGSFAYAYDNGGPGSRRGRDRVPEGAPAHDLHSAMLLLRSWRPRLGEAAYFYVVLGRRLWRVDVTAAGPEVIKTNGVPQLTHRIDGVGIRLWRPEKAARRSFSLWLLEGAERVPVRMVADASFGEVTMTLKERDVRGSRCDELGRPAQASSDVSGRVGSAWHSAVPAGAPRR